MQLAGTPGAVRPWREGALIRRMIQTGLLDRQSRGKLGDAAAGIPEITIACRNQHSLERADAWRRHLRTSQLFPTGAISESRLRVLRFAPCLPLMTTKRFQETASLIGAHPIFLG